jgi:hypothetical protein
MQGSIHFMSPHLLSLSTSRIPAWPVEYLDSVRGWAYSWCIVTNVRVYNKHPYHTLHEP